MLGWSRASFVLGLLLVLAGCGGDGRVEVYPVKGTVSFDGRPMQGGGSIAFIPLEGQVGKGAGGIIDKDGTYVMSTYADGDGSMMGKFRVVVTQSVWDEPQNTGDSDGRKGKAAQPVATVTEKERIPAIYSNVDTSPLVIEVDPTENDLPLNLERSAGAPARPAGA